MIKQISNHHYTADEDTSLKELQKAGWVSSVKLSRREDLWGVRLLKLDIPGLTAAGFDILQIHDGPSRKYHYREEQIVPVLKKLQKFLSDEMLPRSPRSVRLFWQEKGKKVKV